VSPTGVALLGSTGSIGEQALDVIRTAPGRFRVVALAAGRSADRLAAQARELPGIKVVQRAGHGAWTRLKAAST
jgi:1-deoxy-D-xylulose-5-phosphate reductoisomerase